jgi:ABC-type branched-subunit amino acid transport system ATPase component
MDSAPILQAQGLSIQFGGVRALDSVDLTVGHGRMLGVIGPNGAGKTTLIDALTGFHSLAAGSIALDAVDITKASPHARRRSGLARSFQSVGLAPGLSVGDNILGTLEALEREWRFFRSRRGARERSAQVLELAELFGLVPYIDQPIAGLPLGTTKLVEMAKVFAGSPRCVLLDEPFAGLAQSEAEERADLLRQIRADTGVAVVVVEHDVPLLLRMVDELMVLDTGRLLAVGDPQEVLAMPRVREAYLGSLEVGAPG